MVVHFQFAWIVITDEQQSSWNVRYVLRWRGSTSPLLRRRWHLQVVETTKVLQLGFSESKSINICSGPDAITWQNWSTSFIIINTSQVCVFWGVLVQSLSVFTFWFGHRAGQSAPWSGFSAQFSLLSVLVWGVHSEQRTSPCAGQCLSPTNTQIR